MSVAWVGAGIAAAGVVSSSISASNAADAQTNAANQANATQQQQYNQTRADNQPFMDRGNAAGDKLSYLLGTGGTPGSSKSTGGVFDQAGYDAATANYQTQLAQYNAGASQSKLKLEPWMEFNADGSSRYGGPGLDAYDTGNGTAVSNQGTAPVAPTQDQFTTQSNAQDAANVDSQYGSLLKNFSAADLAADPVYNSGLQFGLDQGTKGINNQAAATGSMLSGATLKALTKYGNDYASSKANDSFNRYQTQNTNTYNKLAGVAGTAQNSNALVASSGANTANQVSSNQLASGNARAASAIGTSNALTSGLSSGYNAYQNNKALTDSSSNSLYKNGYYTGGIAGSTWTNGNDLKG